MAENSEQLKSENVPSDPPLGIKSPLLSRSPLGQTFLQPLGTRSLSVLDRSLFSREGVELQRFPDWDSPFLVESKPRLGNETIIQEQPLPTADKLTPNPATSNPEISSIPTAEEPQVRRELAAPSEAINRDSESPNHDNPQPSISQFKPSKSTIFRSALDGIKYPQNYNNFGAKKSTPKTEISKPIHRENVQRKSETSGIEQISETSASEEISDAIASPDSPGIQRQSETSASEAITDAIASPDSSPIQRQSETSAIEEISE
ncbi:hypothetical protein LKE08_19230, partial [Lyngbya sp. CCY1209]|nr:hypothetical protein [Lyngbya sp. CCY1209]